MRRTSKHLTKLPAVLCVQDHQSARGVLERVLFKGVTIGATMGVILASIQHPFIRVFTSDPAVTAQVLQTIPLLCIFLPIDALAAILDGSLLAAKQVGA